MSETKKTKEGKEMQSLMKKAHRFLIFHLLRPELWEYVMIGNDVRPKIVSDRSTHLYKVADGNQMVKFACHNEAPNLFTHFVA